MAYQLTPHALRPLSKSTRQTLALRAAQNETTSVVEADRALVNHLGCGSAEIVRCAVATAKRELGVRSRSKPDALLVAHLGFTAAQIVSTAVEDALRGGA